MLHSPAVFDANELLRAKHSNFDIAQSSIQRLNGKAIPLLPFDLQPHFYFPFSSPRSAFGSPTL